jgi:hypothetical protein
MRAAFGVAVVVAGVCLATAAGCDSFESSNAPEGTDAGSDVGDTDVSGDDGSNDVAADVDIADAAKPFVCPTSAFFCDDFERATLLGSWTRFDGDNDAGDASRLFIDDTVHASPSRSIRAVPALNSAAALSKNLPDAPAPSSVDVTFSLRRGPSASGPAFVLSVELGPPNDGQVMLMLQNGQLATAEQLRTVPDGGDEYFLPQNVRAMTEGVFERLKLRVDHANARIKMFDGAGKEIHDRPLVQVHAPPAGVRLGLVFAGDTTSPHWLDDVVIETTP